jgi:uncharacterized protein (TIGR04255 family)
MDSQKRTLPDFNKPPINEVVLGVQFDKLTNFSTIHPGLLWQKIRTEYPKYTIQPEIAPDKETFEVPKLPKAPKAIFSITPPVPRCWFLDEPENKLIQVQPDRFLHNWKKMTGKEDYPHYSNILPEFKKQWNTFLGFINEEKVGIVNMNHWEVTYVNYIYIGEGWKDLGDMPKLFPFISTNQLETHLHTPEVVTTSLVYAFPEKLARIYIELSPAFRRSDNKPLIQFKLTAKGQLTSNDISELYKQLDFGREIIVKSFTDMTSSEAHRLWERTI